MLISTTFLALDVLSGGRATLASTFEIMVKISDRPVNKQLINEANFYLTFYLHIGLVFANVYIFVSVQGDAKFCS